MNNNKQAFDHWAQTHVLTTVSFWWKNTRSEGEIRIHDRTFNEALVSAKKLGFVEPKWYKPWTWSSGVVTVG